MGSMKIGGMLIKMGGVRVVDARLTAAEQGIWELHRGQGKV